MIEGYQIFCGHTSKHNNNIYEAGLILLEDSPNGPMATLTWRGSYGIRNL